jgi:surface antigen
MLAVYRNALMFLAAALIALALSPSKARADSPPWAPSWGNGHATEVRRCVTVRKGNRVEERCTYHVDDDDRRHGRRKHERREHVSREHTTRQAAAPYGIAQGACNRDLIGGLVGGVTGAILGAQVGKGKGKLAAVAGGALLGALIGGSIGRGMDQVDAGCVGQTLEHAPERQTVTWRNPDNDTDYAVTPVKTFQRDDGRYCREYTATATIGGKPQETYGTACRQPDGSWQIVG